MKKEAKVVAVKPVMNINEKVKLGAYLVCEVEINLYTGSPPLLAHASCIA